MNLLLIFTFYYKDLKYRNNLGNKTVLYLIYVIVLTVLFECKMEKQNSQWSKQEACFACVAQMWLDVNHNTSVISGI